MRRADRTLHWNCMGASAFALGVLNQHRAWRRNEMDLEPIAGHILRLAG